MFHMLSQQTNFTIVEALMQKKLSFLTLIRAVSFYTWRQKIHQFDLTYSSVGWVAENGCPKGKNSNNNQHILEREHRYRRIASNFKNNRLEI